MGFWGSSSTYKLLALRRIWPFRSHSVFHNTVELVSLESYNNDSWKLISNNNDMRNWMLHFGNGSWLVWNLTNGSLHEWLACCELVSSWAHAASHHGLNSSTCPLSENREEGTRQRKREINLLPNLAWKDQTSVTSRPTSWCGGN